MTSLRTLSVSVVVPTRDRPELLRRCLEALLAQNFDRSEYEIVVVDDGHDPGTRGVVETLRERSGGLPLVRCLATGGAHGPAVARNRGWKLAAGEVVAFTDDDTIPDRDWLRQGLQALEPGAAAAAGRIVVPLPERPTDYERDTARLATASFATANCFVRREVMATIGGFDERFTAAWREDADLQFSLIERSAPIQRAPGAVVVHPVRPDRWGVSLRQQRKVMFDALLFRKHPQLYRRFIRAHPRWDYYAVVALGLAAVVAALAGRWSVAAAAFAGWLVLTLLFCLRRLQGTAHTPRHMLEMLVTSAAIPPVAVYWRLVGWLRFRTLVL